MALPSTVNKVISGCISPLRGGSPIRWTSPMRTRSISCASSSNRNGSPLQKSPITKNNSKLIVSGYLSPTRTTSPQRMFSVMHGGSPSRMLSPKRMHGQRRSRTDCRDYPDPPCPPKKKSLSDCDKEECGKRFKEEPCIPPRYVKTTHEQQIVSMWKVPKDCCKLECPDLLPRFDDMYYKPSDKATRTYMQTWAECPKMQILPKKVCCWEKFNSQAIPQVRRHKTHRPLTACSQLYQSELAHECHKDLTSDKRCTKIKVPGCYSTRRNPNCHRRVEPSKCKKICAPYPSYSECIRKKPKAKPNHECSCSEKPFLCEVFEAKRHLDKLMK